MVSQFFTDEYMTNPGQNQVFIVSPPPKLELILLIVEVIFAKAHVVGVRQ